jgi:ketosteroid isomerase-like protein
VTIALQPNTYRSMRTPQTGTARVVHNVAMRIVRMAMDAFDRGDQADFRQALADDVVERDDDSDYVLHRAAAITEALWAMRELFPQAHFEINLVATHPEEVEVEIVWCSQTYTGVAVAGGQSITLETSAPVHDRIIFRVRAGKIVVMSHGSTCLH